MSPNGVSDGAGGTAGSAPVVDWRLLVAMSPGMQPVAGYIRSRLRLCRRGFLLSALLLSNGYASHQASHFDLLTHRTLNALKRPADAGGSFAARFQVRLRVQSPALAASCIPI